MGLCVQVFVCACVCVCMCFCLHVFVCACVYVCMCFRVYEIVSTRLCIYICRCVSQCVDILINVYIIKNIYICTTFFAVTDQAVLDEVVIVVHNTLTANLISLPINLSTINLEIFIVEIILSSYRIAVCCI